MSNPAEPSDDRLRCEISVTTRRAHLEQAHLEALFGPHTELTPLMPLPGGRVAYAEEVTVKGPDGSIRCRVVGPPPKHTRVYLRAKEREALGIADEDAAVLLENSHGCTLEGPEGMLILAEGLLDVVRTLYLTDSNLTAGGWADLDLKVGDTVRVEVHGARTRVLNEVLVRSHPAIDTAEPPAPLLMLDTDEANACELLPTSHAVVLSS